MEQGRASRTAEIVCMGRAVAHGRTSVRRYADPTARILLPEAARARVDRLVTGRAPRGVREHIEKGYFDVQAKVMVTRTVVIDDAVRAAASPELVILGAGLDGRAWRMQELRDIVVFEVDHPASQRDKRERATRLTSFAKDVHFVPVDFQRDSLDDALARAGHDAARPTTWVWEGVVMYLTPGEVDATLSVIARRSAAKSHVIAVYHSPAFFLRLVSFFLRRFGEPLRSAYTPEAMKSLLARHGFEVTSDANIPALSKSLSLDLGPAATRIAPQRIVTATHR